MGCHHPSWRGPSVLLALLLTVPGIVPGQAGDARVGLTVGRIAAGDRMVLSDLELLLLPGAGAARVTVATAELGPVLLTDLAVDCEAFELTAKAVACRGRLRLDHDQPAVGVEAAIRARYGREDESLELSLELAAPAPGLRVDLEARDGAATAQVEWSAVKLAGLPLPLPPDLSLASGSVSGELRAELGAGATRAAGRVCVDDLAFDTQGGTIAAAGLAACAVGEVRGASPGLAFTAALRAPPRGELLAGNLYLDLATVAPVLEVEGASTDRVLRVDALRVTDEAVGTLRLVGESPLADLRAGRWRLDFEALELGPLFSGYLGPLLEAKGIGRLQAAGTADGSISVHGLVPEGGTIALRAATLADGEDRFAVRGLEGAIALADGEAGNASTLRWDEASVYALPLGPSRLDFRLSRDGFELAGPATLPVLDGALEVHALRVAGLAAAGLDVDLRAGIRPISLETVTEALDWPRLKGRIGGQIPRIVLSDGVVEADGRIEIEVFDGRVLAEALRVERLFRTLPTLAADITLENLDLQQLTGAFSFGEITGTLEGHVLGLRLLDWQPVAFDLKLASPRRDPRPRRISQRAVDDLTRIGGGPAGALSTTFLSFFETFAYERLGLSCRLLDDRCTMGGIENAPGGGYYIVKGSGLPRIDVIGYSTSVDFRELRRRLEAATAGGAPRVE